jgi:hypothetical protein
MELNKAMSICIKAGLRIYPIKTKDGFFVRTEEDTDKGTIPNTSKIAHKNNKEVLEAIQKAYIHYGIKLENIPVK